MWRTGRNSSIGSEQDIFGDKQQWMATKPRDSRGRSSTDQRREPTKTVEIDTCSRPYPYLPPNPRTSSQVSQQNRPSSPLHRRNQSQQNCSPITPSPSKTRPVQVRSASPRFAREDRSCHASQTPSLRSNYHYAGSMRPQYNQTENSLMPNYMTPTESAKARTRSQSAPRQRLATPERERSKKRLSYPVPDTCSMVNGYHHSVRSPSFKSVMSAVYTGYEQQSEYSSCNMESLIGDLSPTSASDKLRRYLR